MDERITVDVYFDYACPYVNAAATWLRTVQAELGDRVRVNWRAFPLEQVNSDKGPDWKMWEPQDGRRSKSAMAFLGAIAAKRQGDAAFARFHEAVLRAKHDEGIEIGRKNNLLVIAEAAGLDLDRFERDLDDPAHLALIGRDYEEGRTQHGVFGTPTFVFPNGEAIYLKIQPDKLPEDPIGFFEEFVKIARDRDNVLELKRPRRAA